MVKPVTKHTIIGAGAMGTVCALLQADRGVRVTLWGASSSRVAELNRQRENERYLPGYRLADSIRVVSDPSSAFAESSLNLSAVPCQHMRAVWQRLSAFVPRDVPIVSVAKGIEIDTLLLPTQIIGECIGDVPLGCLSGPSIAPEVAAHKPASLVAASKDRSVAELVQTRLSTSFFRIYTSSDLLGVELAGAVKNVIAIAAGICDGIGAGDNAKASLLTRGLVEITRLGIAMGASAETFRGLAGVGDLFTTCVSKVGRNRTAGERIGRGESAQQVVQSTSSVIEGIPTTRSVLTLADRHQVEMPIVRAVASVLFEGVRSCDAITGLMTRRLGSE